jgi:hypothetical protein
MKQAFAFCIVLTLAAGCSSGSIDDPAPATGRASTEQITGTIVTMSVESSEIASITVEHDGDETEIFIKEDFDYGFDLQHLYSHQEKKQPVRVSIERIDGEPFATAIDDA